MQGVSAKENPFCVRWRGERDRRGSVRGERDRERERGERGREGEREWRARESEEGGREIERERDDVVGSMCGKLFLGKGGGGGVGRE